MAKIEKMREAVDVLPSADVIEQRARDGWKLVAVEWERTVDLSEPELRTLEEEIPYGLRVASDCRHLEEDPTEKQVLVHLLERVVQDSPFRELARELNHKGFRTREGTTWNPVAVFSLLPRLVEVGPQIFSTEEWSRRRKQLFRAGSNARA